jgi:hypothetical protein
MGSCGVKNRRTRRLGIKVGTEAFRAAFTSSITTKFSFPLTKTSKSIRKHDLIRFFISMRTSLIRNALTTFNRHALTASQKPRPGRKGPVLGLDHFIQRSKTLALWREIMRSIYRIPASSTRDEMRQFARGEFEQHRHVTDLHHIRYLVSSGKTQFDAMKRYIDEQAGR